MKDDFSTKMNPPVLSNIDINYASDKGECFACKDRKRKRHNIYIGNTQGRTSQGVAVTLCSKCLLELAKKSYTAYKKG